MKLEIDESNLKSGQQEVIFHEQESFSFGELGGFDLNDNSSSIVDESLYKG